MDKCKGKIFNPQQLKYLRGNIFITILAWLIVLTALAGGTGKLDLFNASSKCSNDTLKLAVSIANNQPPNSIPERFKLYDLDSNGEISEWEMNDAVRDFKSQDTPYSHQEMTAFLDYFFKDR
jgi:hypothetical protein